jgi:hypothetical protein
MALTIDQISAVSFPKIVAENKRPANQWEDRTALKLMEKMGCVERVNFGDNIEVPVDYRPNPDGGVLVADQDTSAMLKTEVLTSAVFEIAQVSYWVTWTVGDEVRNSTEAQKVNLVKALLENGIATHDDLLERTIFTSSTAGGVVEVLGLDTLCPNTGQGSPGGIAAATETWWQNPAAQYTDETDIEAVFTAVYNDCLKGSGSPTGPKFLLSGPTPHALYESTLQALQRFETSDTASGGFKALQFKGLPYAFSQYGADEVYFLNPKSYKMLVSQGHYRDKGDTERIPGQNAWQFPIYTALQNVTTNKSRIGVAYLS